MTEFTVHDIDSAPERSRPLLEDSQAGFGMIPNLHGVLAESPQALEAYKTLTRLFLESDLSTTEKHVVWLTVNVANRCGYCVPAHTALAKNDGVDDDVIQALRNGRSLDDARLDALRRFALSVLDNQGHVDSASLRDFYSAGFEKRHVLDVVLGVTHKILSNWTNHITETPVDRAFESFNWQPASAA